MKIKLKKNSKRALLPVYATEGAGCFDLRACLDEGEQVRVAYGSPQNVSTGLSFEIPPGTVMLIFSRSGHGFKNDVRLSNCVGVIDSDYRGEVRIKLTCDSPNQMLNVSHGDRIAQALLVSYSQVHFDVVDELGSTKRGEGGFGSTGHN